MKLHIGYVTLISMYTPTNELRNEEESVKFYQALHTVVSQISERDMMMILGDFNARFGNTVET